MKILVIDTEPVRRGAQIFISELSSFLDKIGVETKVVYLYQPANESDKLTSSPHRATVLKGRKNSFSEKLPGLHPALISKLLQEIQSFSPDVVLSNGSRTLKYSAAARQFYKGDAKWIARWIDDAAFWNPSPASKWIYKKMIMPQFDATIGVSQASLDSMIRHYDFRKPGTVIHRVFHPDKFKNAPGREEARRKLGMGAEENVLLFLGNLTAQKRPDRFLEIVSQLSKSRRNLKALIVGDGPLREALENHVSGVQKLEARVKNQESRITNRETGYQVDDSDKSNVLFLASCVSFFGYQQDVSPYLAAADILVLTSDTEGLPGVVLEAAHFGVPTVATEVGGIRECLTDSETGLLVTDRSVEGFCERINFLLDHPGQKNQMGKKAQEFVSKNFRIEEVARQYVDFFKKVIS